MVENNFSKYVSNMVNSNVISTKDDIIYTRTGQIGLAFKGYEGVVHNNSFIVNIESNELDKDYLYVVLNSEFVRNQALSLAKNSVQPDLTHDMFKSIVIPFFDVEKQKNIAKTILLLERKIKNNNLINLKLESLAKSIFEYWFMQYEFPDKNENHYRSFGGTMIWNEYMKKEIPENWEIHNLRHFIKNEKIGDWGKEKQVGNYNYKISCIRGADFPSLLGKEKMNAPSRYILNKNSNKILQKNDIIIEISGGSPTQSTGRVCYINENTLKRFDSNIIISNFCKAITLYDSNYNYWFYLLWKILYENDVFFKYEGKTTGIKNLLFDMLCNDYFVVTPNEEIVKKFNQKVSVMFETIQKNCCENEKLEKIKNFILPLIMTGKIEIK